MEKVLHLSVLSRLKNNGHDSKKVTAGRDACEMNSTIVPVNSDYYLGYTEHRTRAR